MCCTRLAENTGRKNYAKNRYLGTTLQLQIDENLLGLPNDPSARCLVSIFIIEFNSNLFPVLYSP